MTRQRYWLGLLQRLCCFTALVTQERFSAPRLPWWVNLRVQVKILTWSCNGDLWCPLTVLWSQCISSLGRICSTAAEVIKINNKSKAQSGKSSSLVCWQQVCHVICPWPLSATGHSASSVCLPVSPSEKRGLYVFHAVGNCWFLPTW